MSNDFEGRDLLTAIVDMAEQNRPVKWIARSTGVDPRDINAVLKVAGVDGHDVHSLEKYDRIEYMVQDGVSHSEIARTLRCDHRTIERWFPGTGWTSGGWAEYGGLIRELMGQQREFERTGKITRKGNRVLMNTKAQDELRRAERNGFANYAGFEAPL